jgi:hypothetical protein
LNWNTISNGVKMVTGKKPTENPGEEKEVGKPTRTRKHIRRKGQGAIARQYKEAKRRHDNLSENQEDE